MPTTKAKQCYFKSNNIKEIDYKDVELLKKFTNSYGQILPSRRTGVSATYQRKLATAIKRARIMALIHFPNQRR
ncbi:MAG: 30S ribosomal protein S18 [Patescibacteria group bacterium]|nr:MAG: 30S ribosomal protein S18 [Patescibacteria group bacterium]